MDLLCCILLSPVLVIVVAILLWYKKWFHHFRNLKCIPGPQPLPLFGSAFMIKDTTETFWLLHSIFLKYGNVIKGALGFDMLVGVSDPDFLEVICTNQKTQAKGVHYRFLYNWLSFGLLTSKGEKWRKRRKMITPAYHFKILEQFVDVFEKNGKIMVEKLRQEIGKGSFDVNKYVTLCALDTINETAMGTSVNAQNNDNNEYVLAIKEMTRIIVERAVTISKYFDFLYQFTKDYQIEQKCVNTLHNYTLSVIESRRRELIKNPQQNDPTFVDEFGMKKRVAFLDLLLQSTIDGKPLSDEDIREEVDTFMFEGHDTVSTAMCFWFYLVSKHPEAQRKLLEEQRQIYGGQPDRPTTYTDLQLMNYLDMTIKETLRLFPSVPILTRNVTEDFTFKNMIIKKDTQIAIFPYHLHRRADIYSDPDAFIPERFSAENQSKRHAFSYLAFSAGFRNCIGQRFAMLEMKATLSKVLRNFEICPSVPEHHIVLKSEIILASGNGYMIQLKNRNW